MAKENFNDAFKALEDLKGKFNSIGIPCFSTYPRGVQVPWENFMSVMNDDRIAEFLDNLMADDFDALKVTEMAYALTRLGRKEASIIVIDKVLDNIEES